MKQKMGAVSIAMLLSISISMSLAAVEKKISAAELIDAMHPDYSRPQAVVYHDLQMDGAYHLYFTFMRRASGLEYRKWTVARVMKELVPAIDRYACLTSPPREVGLEPFRRNGGALVIHFRDDAVDETAFHLDVVIPPSEKVCQP